MAGYAEAEGWHDLADVIRVIEYKVTWREEIDCITVGAVLPEHERLVNILAATVIWPPRT
jgi:hypothetical protein